MTKWRLEQTYQMLQMQMINSHFLTFKLVSYIALFQAFIYARLIASLRISYSGRHRPRLQRATNSQASLSLLLLLIPCCLPLRSAGFLLVRLVCRSIGESVGRLVGWLVGWSVGHLLGQSVSRGHFDHFRYSHLIWRDWILATRAKGKGLT